METPTPNADIAAALAKIKPLFNDNQLDAAETFLQARLPQVDLDAANTALHSLNNKLRRLELRDFAIILLIHMISCQENHGESPYLRFTAWSSSDHNTYTGPFNNRHVQIVLTVLVALKLTRIVQEHGPGKCRKYQMHGSVTNALECPPGIPTPKTKP